MNRDAPSRGNGFPALRPFAVRALAVSCAWLLLSLCGCRRILPVDTTPLDKSGMSFSAIQQLKSLGISSSEVQQLVHAKEGGLSDQGCLDLVRLARSRKEKFSSGDAVAGLLRAGMAENTVLQLAHLHQLGLWSGEAQAMRLAGLSDEIILEVARHRAAGLPVLSGVSLANLKNTGMSAHTLLELVRRSVPERDAATIIALRHRGWSDTRILRRYASSAPHRD